MELEEVEDGVGWIDRMTEDRPVASEEETTHQ
jgi:hypothetical protein